MPRVHTRTKSARAKRPYICRGCGKEVTKGQRFHTWQKRYGGPQYRHVDCGYPRPTELSNRKTAMVEEAVQDAENEISQWEPELDDDGDFTGDYADVTASLESVADSAEEVADEYEASADNMPENLQYGYQAEAMREVANELRDYADNLRSFSPNEDEPDLGEGYDPDLDESEPLTEEDAESGREKWMDERQTALSDWADGVRSDASDLMGEIPEYQG